MPGAYLAINAIDSDVVITPSTEDASYPTENLYDQQAANVFRCTSLTALTIALDFGGPITADIVALINHNLTSGATLSLKADNSSPATTTRATPTYRQYDLWKGFVSTTARYWLLTIADTNAEAIQIGQLILGVRIALPRARRIAESYSPARMRSTISGETYAGVFWNYHLFERRRFNPSFRIASAAELAILDTLDRSVYGDVRPFLYIPDGTGADCYYVRKEQSFEPQELDRIAGGEIAHDYQMTLVEESRGLEILE